MEQTTSRPAITSPLLSMWALFTGVLLLQLGNGLQGTLLGVRSTLEGFDTFVIGIILAAYYAAFWPVHASLCERSERSAMSESSPHWHLWHRRRRCSMRCS